MTKNQDYNNEEQQVYVRFKNNKIAEISVPSDFSSEDYMLYTFDDDENLKESYETYKCYRRLYVQYENNKVNNYWYHNDRQFGSAPLIGSDAPTIDKILGEFNITRDDLFVNR